MVDVTAVLCMVAGTAELCMAARAAVLCMTAVTAVLCMAAVTAVLHITAGTAGLCRDLSLWDHSWCDAGYPLLSREPRSRTLYAWNPPTLPA